MNYNIRSARLEGNKLQCRRGNKHSQSALSAASFFRRLAASSQMEFASNFATTPDAGPACSLVSACRFHYKLCWNKNMASSI